MGGAAVRPGLALAAGARRFAVVSDAAAVSPTASGRLGERVRTHRAGAARAGTVTAPPRSQTLFGNAVLRKLRFPRFATTRETEFRGVRSQTEFGNEDVTGYR